MIVPPANSELCPAGVCEPAVESEGLVESRNNDIECRRPARRRRHHSWTPAIQTLESRQLLTVIAFYDFEHAAGDGDFDNATFESVDTDGDTTASIQLDGVRTCRGTVRLDVTPESG